MDIFGQIGYPIQYIQQRQSKVSNELIDGLASVILEEQADIYKHKNDTQYENANYKQNLVQKVATQQNSNFIGGQHNQRFFQSIFSRIANKNDEALQQLTTKIQAIQINQQTAIIKEAIVSFQNAEILTLKRDINEPFSIQINNDDKYFKNNKNIKQEPSQIDRGALNGVQNDSKKLLNRKIVLKYQLQSQNPERQQSSKQQKRSKSRRTIRLQHYQSKKNPEPEAQKLQKTAKQILIQLQQLHLKKSVQRQRQIHKSLNIRTKIIKLAPQATLQDRQKKQKQAQTKLLNNIQFLQYIKKPTKKQNMISKQFKNDLQQIVKLTSNKRIKTLRRDEHANSNNGIFSPSSKNIGRQLKQQTIFSPKKYKHHNVILQNQNLMYENNSSSQIFRNQSSSHKKKLPPVEKPKHLVKPKPYSVYNIYQKNNEIYMNRPFIRD